MRGLHGGLRSGWIDFFRFDLMDGLENLWFCIFVGWDGFVVSRWVSGTVGFKKDVLIALF